MKQEVLLGPSLATANILEDKRGFYNHGNTHVHGVWYNKERVMYVRPFI